ncbi:SPRY domain-containing SOCS box protein 3-like [Ambystoma mexicanum]|uniref:SPRY domain-containing SOCS box protein 3-like n=1 Tax=Ambystoma mexicanum TaxID=8296 RepID=UPI0037E8FFAF
MPPSALPVTAGYMEEPWVWDINTKSPAAELSSCQQAVYFHIDPIVESQGTAGVRGTKGFSHGEHYWEIEFLEPPYGLSVMLGVGTHKALLHAGNHTYIDLLGKDSESWGLSYKGFLWHGGACRRYTEPFYDKRTVIGVHLNMTEGTLTFFRKGQSLGLAFTGLDTVRSPLYPMVCSTAAGTELQVRMQRCRLPSLQESCLFTVSQSLLDKAMADTLPLPRAVKGLLKHFSGKTTHALTTSS